ncbi:isopenicillin N synthase family oxygenase [Salipiger sp. P9]|uniref:isopenicillin N synthase family dioxygenase n=1 Tax=Salipiger pentaromativorans TaxID=2943193 RepID=UPI00215894C6|nr:2OG-Fe(II) oxygenase family protein [Salipiger pentaromativorans]MCR8550551.1 isopenicillin N synthase family oxygenase [Salipiger pentaromativorans]
MTYATARKTLADEIPVIDITPLRDGSDPDGVAHALHAASTGLGFIYVRGHGIPEAAIDAARAAAYAFFHADPAQKEEVRAGSNHRGWLAQGGAKMQDGAKADLKESFIWGFQDADGVTPDDHPLRGNNRWPGFQPELEEAAMTYFSAAHEVAHHLMRGFACGLGLEEGFFLKTADKPLSRGSFVYYPPQDASHGADQFGVGPHTDFGVLTVLCQDDVGGLQVQDVTGEWIEAPPIPGTLLVNVADLLARWTDGAYKSTPHRVVNASGRERMSLVVAYDPNPETRIDPREVFGPEHGAAEEPITCGDYLVWRFGKAFTYGKS